MNRYFFLVVFLCIFLWMSGCVDKGKTIRGTLTLHIQDTGTANSIQHYFENEDVRTKGLYKQVELSSSHLIFTHYRNRDFVPYWSQKAKISKKADEALELLSRAEEFGLQKKDYDYEALYTLANNAASADQGKAAAGQLVVFDLRLTNSMLLFISHLHNGRLNPFSLKVVRSLYRSKIDLFAVLDSALLENDFTGIVVGCQPKHPEYQRLQKELSHYIKTVHKDFVLPNEKKRPAAFRAMVHQIIKESGYDELSFEQAVKRYQYFHGLPQTGKLDENTVDALSIPECQRYQQMVVNLERWRWEPEYESEYVFINIPTYMLLIKKNDSITAQHKVIVGLSENPTPQLSSKITSFIVNPDWSIPFSISTKEILPILKENPSYLDQKNYILLNKENKEIDPYSIDWEKVTEDNFHFFIRQGAGDDNALGYMKFTFPNKFSVYLHDTPFRTLFEKDKRAFSHGCVRVEFPVKLAEYFMKRDSIKMSAKRIEELIEKKDTRHIKLKNPMPIHIKYFTCEATTKGIFFYADIYSMDQRIIDAFFE